MASSTEICNMALSHLGVGKEINNLTTESSEEAGACRRFYDMAQDRVLRAANWPFATKIIALNLIEEDPNDEWEYSYRYPNDCIFFRKILSGTRNETRQSRVPYRVAYDSTGRIIFTDTENAEAEYTLRVTDPDKYPPDFTMAFSLLLAHLIAPRLTAGDPFKMGERAFKLYQMEIDTAKANSFNEEQPEQEPSSELERARE
jgi:hypothetical protein